MTDTRQQDDAPTAVEAPATLAYDEERLDDSAELGTRFVGASGGGRPEAAPEVPLQVGRFRILRCIGSGGMGMVYAGHDDELDRDVAIKILRSDLARGRTGRERLVREAQAIAKLSHPNIVHVYEVGQDDAQVYMAMELIRGHTMRNWRRAEARDWTEIVDVFLGAGEGLRAAHAESIVHRDFKPDNVIVGDEGRPRVVDFGLARAYDTVSVDPEHATPSEPASGSGTFDEALLQLGLTATGIVVGTPAYLAPEQLAQGEPDARTDQYAFCVSLFEMLYGRRPFGGKKFGELAEAIEKGRPVAVDPSEHGVPARVHAVVMRGLSKRPQERFGSMAELLEALQQARTPRPRRVVAYLLGVAAVVGLVANVVRSPEATAPAAAATEPASPPDPWAEIVAGTELPETIETPDPDDPAGVSIHRLRNGLTVYVASRPLEPHVAVSISVRAGSEQERGYAAGLGFMVMMSLYEGTDRIGVTDADAERPSRIMQQTLLSALGSIHDPNARKAILRAVAAAQDASAPLTLPDDLDDASETLGGTSLSGFRGSGTMLSAELPPHRVAGWLQIMSEAVQRPAFRNLYGVVQQQLVRYDELTTEAHASLLIQQELTAATGLLEDYASAAEYVSTFPIHDAEAFHRTYYRPNNTAIVFVGDITPAAAIEACEAAFGDWAPAAIPTRAPTDEPLRMPVVRNEVVDGGPPTVRMAWPLPPTQSASYAGFETLVDALNSSDGLAGELRRRIAHASWQLTPQRSLLVRAVALPGQSLDEVEAETIGMLEAIAEDRLSDETWASALARVELTRLEWSKTPEAIAKYVASSFIERGSWTDVAQRLTHAPTRDELAQAAAALLKRSRVVVHQRPGPTWRLPPMELPPARESGPRGKHSAFVREVIDTPVTPPEPRFLVEGSHFESHRYGAGRVITAPTDGPLARLTWVYPVGVDHDRFVCDAVRARERATPIAGIDLRTDCTNDAVWVVVEAKAERLQAQAGELFAWLGGGMPTDADLRGYVERAVGWRVGMRGARDREQAFGSWVLRGEHGINAHRPRDRELTPRALRASLEALDEHAVDVLYAGPSPDAIREALLPPRTMARPARVPIALREVARDTVFVLDDPQRRGVVVQALLPRTGLDAREIQLARMQNQAALDAMYAASRPLDAAWVVYAYPWWTPARMATLAGFEAPNQQAETAVQTALAAIRQRIPPSEFAERKARAEVAFRSNRPRPNLVPRSVRLWEPRRTDPRVDQWMALPGLRYEHMLEYYEATEDEPVLIAVVADLRQVDRKVFGRFGDVVVVSIEELTDLLRDAYIEDEF